MDIIQLLPDSVANQIAAGEVIQRPASVIKELVENAVDAEATIINVFVVDAGRTSIQVIDNGKGMSETDARLAFERHATSKIRQADDLFALHTMGFRGEALASIAAVAQVELKTRLATEEIGTHLSLSGGRVSGQEPVSCPVGSNFSVENLFFNVPVRRKFLKSNATELNQIIDAFQRVVLVNPHIAFTMHSNGVEVFNLKAGSMRQRIFDVFGKKVNQDLLPVGVDTIMCRITGFVGKPESARKKGALQYLFVNGRFMKHPYFHKAVQSAFERLVPVGEQVPYFIYFDVPPENIDVNIHPTKTEIKFENEQAIWQILAAVVKEAVGKFNDVPSIDFDNKDCPDIPVFDPVRDSVKVPQTNINPQYNPFKDSHRKTKSVEFGWEQLYEGAQRLQPQQETALFDDEQADVKQTSIEDKSPIHYQYKGMYVMTAVKSGLMIIDQHRAHMRVLYDNYRQQLRERSGTSQRMLFPDIVHFSASEANEFQKIWSEMESIGFQLVDLGQGSYAINAIPAGLEGINAVTLVQDIVAIAAEQTVSVSDEIHHTLSLSLARNAAIPYGQVLSNNEMENLVNQLFSCENVNYSPDGRLTLTILRQEEIDRLLG